MFIYKITNNVNGKIYVGQTIQTIEARWAKHKSDAKIKKNKTRLYYAIVKYGSDAFKIEVIEDNISDIEILNERERYHIENLHSNDRKIGYNLTDGGDGGYIRSEETKEKLRQANLGKKASDETKQKLSESHIGINTWSKGKILSDETKIKLSILNSGEHNPFYGKQHTDESKKKNSLKHLSRLYIITDPQGNEFEINNLNGWCKENGMCQAGMSNVLNGKSRHCKNYLIRYKDQ